MSTAQCSLQILNRHKEQAWYVYTVTFAYACWHCDGSKYLLVCNMLQLLLSKVQSDK